MVMENSMKLIPTLTPTFEQWKSLPIYLTHHETSLHRRFGAVKILPPSRWVPLIKNPYEIRPIKFYIKQEVVRSSHQSDVFYIQNSETSRRRLMSYEEFKTIAESDAYRLKDTINGNIIEYFWSNISKNPSFHASNIDDSLFDKREVVFNMTNLASLLRYYPKHIPGVTTSMLHMGMWSNSVGIHTDDYDLIYFSYIHHGAPRIWYIIHPSSYSKFEELVNELKLFSDVSSSRSSCLSPLQHKTLLIKPSFLLKHSIEYFQVEQKLNELIVVFPGVYHFYFDTGFNLSETVRFALPSWLTFQRRSPRLCSCSISSTILLSLNRRFFTADILNKYEREHLTPTLSTSSACIDLSTDDDNNNNNNERNNNQNGSMGNVSINDLQTLPIDSNNNNQTNMENEVLTIASHLNISLDQYIDPLYYSSSSSTNSNTPILPNSTTAGNNPSEYESIRNIFDEILSQSTSDSIQNDQHVTSHNPCEPYLSIIPSHHTSTMYTNLYAPYSYSALRLCTPSKRYLKRRKCYGCRRQGHVRKECPYAARE